MTADEFIAWAMTRLEGEHYELVAGEVVAMAPERSAHGLSKVHITRLLGNAIEAAGLPCDVYADSTSVRIEPLGWKYFSLQLAISVLSVLNLRVLPTRLSCSDRSQQPANHA